MNAKKVFLFSPQLLSEIFLILRNTIYIGLHVKYPNVILVQILMTLEFSRQIFE